MIPSAWLKSLPNRNLSTPLSIVATVLLSFSHVAFGTALDDFLTGAVSPDAQELRGKLSYWLELAKTAPEPQDRGIAVANLQFLAWLLLDLPGATPAAMQLLDEWVLPNAALLRSQPQTSACSWESVTFGAYASYKRVGDAPRQKRVLELISSQARDPGLRNMAILRLAGLSVDAGDLRQALEIATKADAWGEFSKERSLLIEYCRQKLKEQTSR